MINLQARLVRVFVSTIMENIEDVIIIGSGPAGYTAAIYAARAELKPLLFEGKEPGGQLMTTTDVENFPGFSKGIMGPDLMKEMKEQAERFGTRIVVDMVTSVDFSGDVHIVKTEDKEYRAKTVIISTGASARRLGLESEKALYGKGVSACATCDGFFFKGKELVVVGGGDSAMEEATFLTKFATKVTILNRSENYRGSTFMIEKARANDKIEFIENVSVSEVLGVEEGRVTGVKLKNAKTGEETEFKTDGMFVAIGHKPNTDMFKDILDMDKIGYLVNENGGVATKIPGVFACGDVMDKKYRQAITAAGTGCMAALEAERFLHQ